MRRLWTLTLLAVLVTAALAAHPEQLYPPGPGLPVPPSYAADAEYSASENCEDGFYGAYSHHHYGIPELFHEPPLGAFVNRAMSAQVRQGVLDQLVIYQYDFMLTPYAADLSPRGKSQLDKYSRLMMYTGAGPLVIEASSNPKLDQARRLSVLEALTAMNDSIPLEAVVIGRPRQPSLRGVEATIIYDTNLANTAARGRMIGPTGSTEASSFSASSTTTTNTGLR